MGEQWTMGIESSIGVGASLTGAREFGEDPPLRDTFPKWPSGWDSTRFTTRTELCCLAGSGKTSPRRGEGEGVQCRRPVGATPTDRVNGRRPSTRVLSATRPPLH
jgi:hypothetical protein